MEVLFDLSLQFKNKTISNRKAVYVSNYYMKKFKRSGVKIINDEYRKQWAARGGYFIGTSSFGQIGRKWMRFRRWFYSQFPQVFEHKPIKDRFDLTGQFRKSMMSKWGYKGLRGKILIKHKDSKEKGFYTMDGFSTLPKWDIRPIEQAERMPARFRTDTHFIYTYAKERREGGGRIGKIDIEERPVKGIHSRIVAMEKASGRRTRGRFGFDVKGVKKLFDNFKYNVKLMVRRMSR